MTTLETTTGPESAATDADELLVSVVIPCLNEEENIEECVRTALGVLEREGIRGEVVVANNASEDRSAELATAAGARVVLEPRRGYGSAYLAGFAVQTGTGWSKVIDDQDAILDAECLRFDDFDAQRGANDGG